MTGSRPPAAEDSEPGRLTVIGVDGSPLSPPAQAVLAAADLVVGAPQVLAALAVTVPGERLALGPLAPALDRIRAVTRDAVTRDAVTRDAVTRDAVTRDAAAAGRVVVLAGGDPGLFGIVRRLREEGLPVEVLPAVSSVATLFARLARSWESTAVVSAHGRDLASALNACRALPVVAVLTGPGAGPAELGAGLVGWPRRLSVGERLGTGEERVVTDLTPEQAAAGTWAEPNTVITLPAPTSATPADADPATAPSPVQAGDADPWHNQPAAAPEAGWALPEDAYAHRNSMITKREVRALAVARLRPRLGRLLWDVGAGSGSVGIECAALGAAVIAVDSDPDACDQVRGNAARHGVTVRVVPGHAPEVLAGLPAPDAAFVGGGGTSVLQAVAARRPAQLVAALAGLDRLVAGVEVLRGHGYSVDAVQLSASRLADLGRGSLRLTATNPIVVLTGERP